MEAYFASLLRENAASTIVLVRDDAVICEDRKQDFDAEEVADDEDWQRPSSYKNTTEVNPAPIIPARKESNDSLVLATLTEEDSSQKHGGFFDKFRGLKLSNMKYKRKKQVGSWPIAPNEEHAAWETKDDICLSSTREPHHHQNKTERNSWDGSFSELWKDNIPPTLPLRKRSEDSLMEQATETVTTSSTSCRQQRRGSLDNALTLPTSQSKSRHLRRGSLDNSILMVDEQTKRHFQRRGSLDNALLPSKIDSKQVFQSPEDASTGRISWPNTGRFQRRSSLDNAMVSSNNQAQLRSKRRSSMDNSAVMRDVDQEYATNRKFPRRSSMDNMYMPAREHEVQHSKQDTNASVSNLNEPQQQSNIKKRILSKLNSPKWQSKMKLSSDIFKLSSLNGDDDCSAIEDVPACRQISDDQMSLLSDDSIKV